MWRSRLFISQWTKKQRTGHKGRVQGKIQSLRTHTQWPTSSSHTGSSITSQKSTDILNPCIGLNHWLGEVSHDVTVSGSNLTDTQSNALFRSPRCFSIQSSYN
jgi:hypothetical protein